MDDFKPTEEQVRAMIGVVRPLALETCQKYNRALTRVMDETRVTELDHAYIMTQRMTIAFLAEVIASLFSTPMGCHRALIEQMHSKQGANNIELYDIVKQGPKFGEALLNEWIEYLFLSCRQALKAYDVGMSEAVDELKVERGVSKGAVDELMAKVMAGEVGK